MRDLNESEIAEISGGFDMFGMNCKTETVCRTDFSGNNVCEVRLVCS